MLTNNDTADRDVSWCHLWAIIHFPNGQLMTVKLVTHSSEAIPKAPGVFPLLHLMVEVKRQGPVTIALIVPLNQCLWLSHLKKTPFLNSIPMATKFHHGFLIEKTLKPWHCGFYHGLQDVLLPLCLLRVCEMNVHVSFQNETKTEVAIVCDSSLYADPLPRLSLSLCADSGNPCRN